MDPAPLAALIEKSSKQKTGNKKGVFMISRRPLSLTAFPLQKYFLHPIHIGSVIEGDFFHLHVRRLIAVMEMGKLACHIEVLPAGFLFFRFKK